MGRRMIRTSPENQLGLVHAITPGSKIKTITFFLLQNERLNHSYLMDNRFLF